MKIKIKKMRPNAKLPEYKTEGSVAMDFHASLEGVKLGTRGLGDRELIIMPGEITAVPLGVGMQLEPGYEMRIRPRSSMLLEGIRVLTHDEDDEVGTIDSDYRGEVHAIVQNISKKAFIVNEGDRICQGIITRVECPANGIEIEEAEELDDTTRGDGKFGHTGK